MSKGRFVSAEAVTKAMTQPYWVEMWGVPSLQVPLEKANEIKLEPLLGVKKRMPAQTEKVGRRFEQNITNQTWTSDRNLRLYQYWFHFLKLALELESLGVNLIVTKQGSWHKESSAKRNGKIFRTKDTEAFKVRRKFYEEWDLDEVLEAPFNKWWETHDHLFQGEHPEFFDPLQTPLDQINNQRYLYVKLDKTLEIKDVKDFILRKVQKRLTGNPGFSIEGNLRPETLQNGYNALVLSLKGKLTAQEICEHQNIYLRAPDSRSGGERLNVSKDRKGKRLYSKTVSTQRNFGIHYLLNTMNGTFGACNSEWGQNDDGL